MVVCGKTLPWGWVVYKSVSAHFMENSIVNMKKIFFFLIRLVLLLVLPFICLIRGAVFGHEYYQLSSWPAILLGMGISIFLLMLYFTFIYGRITGKMGSARSFKLRILFAIFLVLGYSTYAVVYLSDSNVKSSEIKDTYSSLHPILRLSISTVVFIDKSLLITDGKRQPEDYKKMGLKTKRQSLHYVQSDGYVHAVDIRTKRHGEFRNGLLKLYFRMMGLNTLRHVGTEDHLHISLSSKDKPGGI